jgi:alcohol dehydrogenase, propanol-preferring
MIAARIVGPKQPLELLELKTPKPKGSQVLVKVEAAGVCHSDIHLWEGGYEGSEGQFLKTTDRGVSYLLTPGHEVAGSIESIGEETEGFKKDDKVLVFPW